MTDIRSPVIFALFIVQCPDKPNVTMNVLCTICGGAGHLSKDCKQKRPGQPGPNPAPHDKAKIDEEVSIFLPLFPDF